MRLQEYQYQGEYDRTWHDPDHENSLMKAVPEQEAGLLPASNYRSEEE